MCCYFKQNYDSAAGMNTQHSMIRISRAGVVFGPSQLWRMDYEMRGTPLGPRSTDDAADVRQRVTPAIYLRLYQI